MEGFRKVEPSRKLITKGCCFLCLTNEEIIQTKYEGNQVVKSTSVKSLLRHLEITAQSLCKGPLVGEDFKKEDIQVDLCENCEHSISRLSTLLKKLEMIQLEMNYFLERIHKCILQSAKDSELVQNYSKRMTSDLEALSQLAFVDNLRKEVSKKCLKELNVPRLQVILNKENIKAIKAEPTDNASETNMDFPKNVDSTNEILPDFITSLPPSPNLTDVQEEELKFDSASTLTENEKLSASFGQSVKQTAKKNECYKKHPSTGMYECIKCEKKSKYSQTIIRHYKSVHLKLRHNCDICNTSVFSCSRALIMHRKTCREKLERKLAKEKDPKFKFICKPCGKRFDTSRKLVTHTRMVHKNANRFKCDRCDKKYTSIFMLKSHQAAIHQSRKLYCKKCNKMYKDLGRYRKHERNCSAVIKVKLEIV